VIARGSRSSFLLGAMASETRGGEGDQKKDMPAKVD
jgi:hypothetical protein